MPRPKKDVNVALYMVEWEDWMDAPLGPYKVFKLKTKLCTRCEQEKSISEFYKNKRAKDGLRTECKICGNIQAKKWAKENKKQHYASVKKYRLKKRKWYEEYKSNITCKICGENHSACLEFHHRNPDEKDFSVAYMVETQSFKRLVEEMKKCDIFCSNCHKKLHYNLKRGI